MRRRLRMPRTSNKGSEFQYSFWHQFLVPGEQLLVAQGGKGGIAPSTLRARDGREPETGEEKSLQLELRLMVIRYLLKLWIIKDLCRLMWH